MTTTVQKKESERPPMEIVVRRAPSINHQPRPKRFYFDVALGSLCLSGADTGGAYCLLEVSLAPGIGVPRHTHTREDETYYVTSGELEVIVGEEILFRRQATVSWLRVTSPTRCAILAAPRIIISSYFRLLDSRTLSWSRPSRAGQCGRSD